MRSAIYGKLNNATAAEARVFGGQIAPQNIESPFIVFWLTGSTEELDHNGAHEAREVTVQVSCFGAGYTQAVELAEQVSVILRAWKNTGSVSHALKTTESDIFEQDVGLYHIPVIATIKYYE